MSLDWKAAYDAALRERDPAKVSEACDRARILINDRALDLVTQGLTMDSPEREELHEALRQLLIHENKIQP